MMKTITLILSFAALAAVTGCSSTDIQYVDEAAMEKLQQERSANMTPMIEEELNKWTPDHTNLASVIKEIHTPSMVVVGSWTTPMFMEGSTLEIAQQEKNLLVGFSTGGCLGDWDLSRTGVVMNGFLRLNRPVQEYCPFTYDTLYPVRVDGRDYLISQSGIRFLKEHYATNGVVRWAKHIEHAAFHRMKYKGAQQSPGGNVLKAAPQE